MNPPSLQLQRLSLLAVGLVIAAVSYLQIHQVSIPASATAHASGVVTNQNLYALPIPRLTTDTSCAPTASFTLNHATYQATYPGPGTTNACTLVAGDHVAIRYNPLDPTQAYVVPLSTDQLANYLGIAAGAAIALFALARLLYRNQDVKEL